MSANNPSVISFNDLNLPEALLKSLRDSGYETPSPIQQQAIPALMQGGDLLGHAPTGTGKTAAFALPLLAKIDLSVNRVQMLVLAPTRELAIQVAEAMQHYAKYLKNFHVLPIYGGQDYSGQIRQLNRGVQVVVGTPGRVMDHIRRGTLKLDSVSSLVLDEADEMLRMGFIDDVEWILEQLPAERQTALFSATMPKQIERIARKHLNNPAHIAIKSETATAETITQRYWMVSGVHKLDALTRILEVEEFAAIIIFTRTKTMTEELAEKLSARGYAAAAINGDMAQKSREMMVERLKSGKLDILVATDVAARGLDVERISHVINYDIPHDTESYIHRIGRTGRAGREGQAIVFVAPRERHLLRSIEKATRKKIDELVLPSTETVNNQRIARFKQKITDTIAGGELAFFENLLEQYEHEHNVPAMQIAAALAVLSTSDSPLLLKEEKPRKARKTNDRNHPEKRDRFERGDRKKPSREGSKVKMPSKPEDGMERFRLEVGRQNNIAPRNVVGAIANEAGLDSAHIGTIEINDSYTLVDLPSGMPDEVFNDLKKARIGGRAMNISRLIEKKAKPRKKLKFKD